MEPIVGFGSLGSERDPSPRFDNSARRKRYSLQSRLAGLGAILHLPEARGGGSTHVRLSGILAAKTIQDSRDNANRDRYINHTSLPGIL